uniref:Uncharacterized protein n=1 Tax=Acrobeloides nanus TaxID=290746 RepID=A0A914BUG3_9BILA
MCRTSNIIESEELSVFEPIEEKKSLMQGIDHWLQHVNANRIRNEALVKKLEQYIAELESNYDFLEEMNRQLQSQFPCTLQADVSQESEIEDSSQESE